MQFVYYRDSSNSSLCSTDVESDLAVDPSLESDLQDFNFTNNEENTLYPIDFTLLEETQAVSNACSLMIEESHLHSSQSFKFDWYEDHPVKLNDVSQLFPNPLNIITPPPSNQQAGDVPTVSKGKELSLELKSAVSTSSGAPSTPELIRTILHLESTGDQLVVIFHFYMDNERFFHSTMKFFLTDC